MLPINWIQQPSGSSAGLQPSWKVIALYSVTVSIISLGLIHLQIPDSKINSWISCTADESNQETGPASAQLKPQLLLMPGNQTETKGKILTVFRSKKESFNLGLNTWQEVIAQEKRLKFWVVHRVNHNCAWRRHVSSDNTLTLHHMTTCSCRTSFGWGNV